MADRTPWPQNFLDVGESGGFVVEVGAGQNELGLISLSSLRLIVVGL
jgi:hypothetical protein